MLQVALVLFFKLKDEELCVDFENPWLPPRCGIYGMWGHSDDICLASMGKTLPSRAAPLSELAPLLPLGPAAKVQSIDVTNQPYIEAGSAGTSPPEVVSPKGGEASDSKAELVKAGDLVATMDLITETEEGEIPSSPPVRVNAPEKIAPHSTPSLFTKKMRPLNYQRPLRLTSSLFQRTRRMSRVGSPHQNLGIKITNPSIELFLLVKAQNSIRELKRRDGSVTTKSEEIKEEAECFFREFLQLIPNDYMGVMIEEMQDLLLFCCCDLDKDLLTHSVSAAEIKKVLFSMPNDKSPGVDGFNAEFYKLTWDIIGDVLLWPFNLSFPKVSFLNVSTPISLL